MIIEGPTVANRPACWRPMGVTDLDEVLEIEQESRPSPWSRADFETDLHNRQPPRLYCLAGAQQILGYLCIWLIADEIQIQNIVVRPAYRGLRLGGWMLGQGLLLGATLGGREAHLEVRASNRPAIALYTRYRFEPVARRKRYYRDGEDAIVMTLREKEVGLKTMITQRLQEIVDQQRKLGLWDPSA